MNVRTRLLTGFGVVSLLLLVPSLFAAWRLAQLTELAVEGRSGQAAAVASLGRMQAALSDLDRLERSLIATSDRVLGVAATAAADSLLVAYGRLHTSPYGEQARELGPAVADIQAISREIGGLVDEGRIADATAALGRMITAFEDLERGSAVVAASIDSLARADFVRAEQLSDTARTRTLLGLVLAAIVAGLVIALTTRALTRPLRRLSRAMARVADGTFAAASDLPYERPDEIGELARSFRTMTARLDELDRIKAEFLGMASHELKTPLNVISAYAELIEDEMGEQVSDWHRSLIAGVAEQADIMARLVSRLMDISRLEAGTYTLAPEPVQTRDLVTGIERLFEGLAQVKSVDLRTRVAESAPESLELDVDLVRDEVLGNLVSNALRFTPPGGWIDLEATGVEGGVAFTVTDSGPGIDVEHRDYIFDKHYTVDRTRAVGSGLGLAIAKEMVELHGGLISLVDAPSGVGARFRVTLPLRPISAELEVPSYAAVSEAAAPASAELSTRSGGASHRRRRAPASELTLGV